MQIPYKPKKINILAILFGLLISLSSTAQIRNTAASGVPADTYLTKMEEDVLSIINQYRTSKKLTKLVSDPAFVLEAEMHSAAMATNKTPFSHDGFEARIKRLMQKSGTLRMSAENVAYGQITAAEVVGNWLKSPGHRRNIEGNFTITGIGIAQRKDGTLFFTEIFGAR